MEARKLGQNITLENRALANEKVDKKTRKRQIIEILREEEHQSAREIAYELFVKGLVPFFERNMVAPRITELCQEGILEPTYTDIDSWTGHEVTLYGFTKQVKENGYKTNYS